MSLHFIREQTNCCKKLFEKHLNKVKEKRRIVSYGYRRRIEASGIANKISHSRKTERQRYHQDLENCNIGEEDIGNRSFKKEYVYL